MVAFIITLVLVVGVVFYNPAYANYGAKLCKKPEFACLKVNRHDTWASLFPDEKRRDLEMRLNRMNTKLYKGLILAVPTSSNTNYMDYSPFPNQIDPPGNKVIKVSLSDQAFGAYDANGTLQTWGPVSGAKGYCSDVHRGCHTPLGHFTIQSKEGPGCFSTKFPAGKGGAPMPYCMFFHRGFALHGSYEVPGYHDSHGCIRLFVNDAKWLNRDFTTGETTRVIVEQ